MRLQYRGEMNGGELIHWLKNYWLYSLNNHLVHKKSVKWSRVGLLKGLFILLIPLISLLIRAVCTFNKKLSRSVRNMYLILSFLVCAQSSQVSFMKCVYNLADKQRNRKQSVASLQQRNKRPFSLQAGRHVEINPV